MDTSIQAAEYIGNLGLDDSAMNDAGANDDSQKPMFFAAFGHDEIGTIGTPPTINSGDFAGILMIAVQALEKRTAEQREALETVKAENAMLKARLEALAK